MDALLEQLESAAGGFHDIDRELAALEAHALPTEADISATKTGVLKHEKRVHKALREFNRATGGDTVPAKPPLPVSAKLGTDLTEQSGQPAELTSARQAVLDKLIRAHILRAGLGSVAQKMDSDSGQRGHRLPREQKELAGLLASLDAATHCEPLEPLQSWVEARHSDLQRISSNLYPLLLEFTFRITYVRAGTEAAIAVLNKATQASNVPLNLITTLAGSLALSMQREEIVLAEMLPRLREELVETYWQLAGIPDQSLLLQLVRAWRCAPSTMGFFSDDSATASRLHNAANYKRWSNLVNHPVFVCPIKKEQVKFDESVSMPPCGHLVSTEALLEYVRGHTLEHCPYCPRRFTPSKLREVTFV